jgi:hypothetical protein
MEQENQRKNDETIIFVNKQQIRVTADSLTGRQILELAGLDANQYDLFLVHGQNSEKIEPEQAISIKNGLHFNAILKSVPYG